ncbi:MAG: hypothetical protein ACRDIF_04270, partial [Actinomycetota bacterium]
MDRLVNGDAARWLSAEPGAAGRRDLEIHPTAVVGERVLLGDGSLIGPYAVLLGPCSVGDGNWIGPYVAIGTPAGSRRVSHGGWFAPQGKGVAVGERNVIREYVSIEQGTEGETVVGSGCFIMAYACVGHDVVLEDEVTITNAVHIGGHTRVGRGATLGLGAVIRQRIAIGAGAMVGMQAAVTRDVPPFALAVGAPARVKGANQVGLMRRGTPRRAILALDDLFRSHASHQWLDRLPECLPEDLLYEFERFRMSRT